jgi:predicted amidophosphoribosyltransferase
MAVPVMWRTQKQRYSLQADVCPHCTNAVFPPRKVCPYCKQPMQAARTEACAGVAAQPVPAPTQGREFLYTMAVPASAVAIAADD